MCYQIAYSNFKFLFSLANKQHIVYTGVCLKTPKVECKFYESAKVKFGDVSERQIRDYIKTGDPMWVMMSLVLLILYCTTLLSK